MKVMEVQGWVILNFYTALLLVLLFIFETKAPRTSAGRRFNELDFMTLLLVVCETIGHIGETFPDKYLVLMKVGYYLIYILDPVDYVFFILYINCWINDKAGLDIKKRFLFVYKAFVVVNFIGITLDMVLGLKLFYYFDGLNYCRGPLFFGRAAILLVLCVMMSLYTIVCWKNIFEGYRFAVFALPTMATLGAAIQIFFTNMTTTYAAISIGLLILFFYIQSKNLDVDYLTGALNRRGLDIRMEEAVKNAQSSGRLFSAIMLDLDHFKQINDTYGHSEGDYALKTVADLLFKVFSHRSAIGCFGGDEFCVITDIASEEELGEKVEIMDDELDKLNYWTEKPYKLEVSMGHMIYDREKNMSAKEFQMAIDELMYIQKRKHHLADNRR